MADTKISDDPLATSATNADDIPFLQGGANKRLKPPVLVSAGLAGYELFVMPDGLVYSTAVSSAPTNSAVAMPVRLASSMYVSGLEFVVVVGGSGTVQWGLFDFTASASAATQLAGGSGALNSTGALQIAASGAPVLVPPGVYMLVVNFPASNCPTVSRAAAAVASRPGHKYQSPYTWDSTPDFTTGWTLDAAVTWAVLCGRLNSSTAW